MCNTNPTNPSPIIRLIILFKCNQKPKYLVLEYILWSALLRIMLMYRSMIYKKKLKDNSGRCRPIMLNQCSFVSNLWAQFSLVDDWTMIIVYMLLFFLFFINFAKMLFKIYGINRTYAINFIPGKNLKIKISTSSQLFVCILSINMDLLLLMDPFLYFFDQDHASNILLIFFDEQKEELWESNQRDEIHYLQKKKNKAIFKKFRDKYWKGWQK